MLYVLLAFVFVKFRLSTWLELWGNMCSIMFCFEVCLLHIQMCKYGSSP